MQNMNSSERYEVIENAQELMKLLRWIFDEPFMQQYSNFEDFNGFCYSSAVIANWNAKRIVYHSGRLDDFVRESTVFSSWDAMVRAATDIKINRIRGNLKLNNEMEEKNEAY